jgi:WD40 repeat protein
LVFDAVSGKQLGAPLIHGVAVSQVEFSKNGRRILSVTAANTVHVWDLASGKELISAVPFRTPVVGAALSPDGRSFLTVSYKPARGTPTEVEVRLWSADTGEPTGPIADAVEGQPAQPLPIGSQLMAREATFSPDGQRVLTLCTDGCARAWDVTTGKQVGASFVQGAGLDRAEYSRNGRVVLTAGSDGTARVWNATSGQALGKPMSHGAAVTVAALSPDGRAVMTVGADDSVRLWNAVSGSVVGESPRSSVATTQAQFSPDGRHFLTADAEGVVRIWDAASGQPAGAPLHHDGVVRSLAFSPAGPALLTFCGQTVRIWDLTGGAAAMPAAKREPAGSVFSADGRLVIRPRGSEAMIFSTADDKPVGEPLKHAHAITAVGFSPDGKRALTVVEDKRDEATEFEVRIWDTATGKQVGDTLDHTRPVIKAIFSNDGQRVATISRDQKLRVFDAATGAPVGKPMDHNSDLSIVLFAPEGDKVLTATAGGAIRLWDVATSQAEVDAMGWRDNPVTCLLFSSDGRRIAAGAASGEARIWNAADGQAIGEPMVHDAAVTCLSFSPDGKRVVTGSRSRAARIWDAGTGKPTTPTLPHRHPVTAAAISADGRWLATAAFDKIRVWDATTGEPITSPMLHGAAGEVVVAVGFTKGDRIASSAGVPSDPHGRRVREFPSEGRTTTDLLLIGRVLTGQTIAEGFGREAPFGGEALSKGWADLVSRFPADFVRPPERATEWHKRGAAECESRGLWAGAVLHLDRLIAAGSTPELVARRDKARSEAEKMLTAAKP